MTMIRSMHFARVLALAAIFFSLSGVSASAQQKEDFTEQRFAALQAQNALVLLDVYADWCPTCKLQQKILAQYREANPGVPLHILTIDFDKQKQYVRQFGAPRQSTLILYRGTERLWFGVAETRPSVIFEELNRAAASGS
jgi:thioredoxin 1